MADNVNKEPDNDDKLRFNEVRKRVSQAQRRADWFSKIVPLVLGLITALGAVLIPVKDIYNPSSSLSVDTQVLTKLDALRSDLNNHQAELKRIQDQLNTLTQNPNLSDTKLKALAMNVNDTQSKLSQLEKVIMENPAKALEMPLLKKDLEGLRDSYKTDLVSTKQEIDRVYDLNKWFLGLMITSSVAIIGLAISNFFKKA